MQGKKASIILLQETHSTEDSEKLWRSVWDGDIVFSHGTSAARGTCILFKSGVAKNILKCSTDDDGRYIILDIEINGLRITLANIYAPNQDTPDFFVNVLHGIESLPNDNRIVGGDFNLVLDLDLDKKGGIKSTNSKSQCLINNWMEETDLIDIWRFHHPEERIYTWYRTKPTKIFCRLDFFLLSYSLTEKKLFHLISSVDIGLITQQLA